jgi:cytidine deaminase
MSKCKNITKNLNKYDKELIKRTKSLMKKYYKKEKFPVACGILDSENKYFFGLAQSSPSGLNICAEPCAFSIANIKSKTKKFKSIVAIRGKSNPMTILSPCGICRELLRFHYPNIDVILVDESTENHKIVKLKSKYLLPFPYYKTRQKEKNAFIKDTWCCKGHHDTMFM